jgi:flagellum-specific peptidoglycan hydrolase FlgJ
MVESINTYFESKNVSKDTADTKEKKSSFNEFIKSDFDINNLSEAQEVLLRTTKSSEFLAAEQKTPGVLKKIFFQKGKINFYKNPSVQRNIGLGDILGNIDKYASIDGIIGKRSYDGNKVGYLDSSGKYIPIYGGEKIVTNISQFENFNEKSFESISSLTTEEEKKYQQTFLTEIEGEEQNQEKLVKDCREEIRKHGLNGIEKPTGRQFFEMAKIVAEQLENTNGIPWQVTVAQALLESGKGRSGLAKNNKNYFGMKGKGRTYWTEEVRNGVRRKERHSFRSYEKFSDSFLDHDQLLLKGRYVAVKNAYKIK